MQSNFAHFHHAFGTVWYRLVPFCTVWYRLVTFGTVWYRLVPFGTVLYRLVPFGNVWYRLVPFRLQISTNTKLNDNGERRRILRCVGNGILTDVAKPFK